MKTGKKTNNILLLGVFLIAFFFRLVGLNWDQNQHLHPDERFLTMVTGAVSWPKTITQYLDPQFSPLNPYNANYGFFVYGTFPMTIVKAVSSLFILDNYDYNNITLVGRVVSALFDLGIIWLILQIGQKVFGRKVGLFAAFFYSIAVLPIQLSHFYAVDTFLVFFMMLTFYWLICYLVAKRQRMVLAIFIGMSMGMALGCKITAIFLVPFVGLGWILRLWRDWATGGNIGKLAKLGKKALATLGLVGIFALFTFRLADPRVFRSGNLTDWNLNPRFVTNLRELKSFDSPKAAFPPAVQWIKTKPIIFPLKNMIWWGFGLPLGLLAVAGVGYGTVREIREIGVIWKKRGISDMGKKMMIFGRWLILGWIVAVFAYQGIQFAKAMRYFYPIYPFLCLLAGNLMAKIYMRFPLGKFFIFYFLFFILITVYPLSFLAIYLKPHSRVMATEWIYQNNPPGSTLSCEHWDDCLPLGLKDKNSSVYRYKTEMLELYNRDTPEKWQKIRQQLNRIDYLIMSSNRLWGSIPKVPEKYPQTAQFYRDLFAEKMDFTKAADITSYPCFPPIGKSWFCFPDQSADESFTVYDHPEVLIYRKSNLNQPK